LKNIIYTIVAISFCLFLGKLIQHFIGGLPASLYGMILYCAFLQFGWFSGDKISKVNQWFIKNMGVCFVPAGVGIINHYELVQQHGFALITIIFISTFALLTIIGLFAEFSFSSSTPRA